MMITHKIQKIAFMLLTLSMVNLTPQMSSATEGDGGIPNNKVAVELLAPLQDDIVLGSHDARVTVVELSSLACPHCADFHTKVFPEINKHYIATGKVRYIFKSFPINIPSTYASMLVSCTPKQDQLRFMAMLFETQRSWGFTYQYREKLQSFARLGGMSDEVFDRCVDNRAAKESLLEQAYSYSQQLGIQHTPTFFINGRMFEGGLSYERFSAKIDEALNAKASN